MNLMRTFQRIYELLKIEQIHDFYLVSWKIKIIFKIRNYYFIFMICTISNESDEDSKFTEFLSLFLVFGKYGTISLLSLSIKR